MDMRSTAWPPRRQHISALVGDVRPAGEAGPVIASIGMAEWHIGSEEENDVELVVESLSDKDTLHCFRCFDAPGHEWLDVEHDQPRTRYRASRDHSETVSSCSYRQIATDWYLFSERSWIVKPVHVDGDGRHVGDPVRGEGLVLVHTQDDGIVGEMVLARYAGLECPPLPGLPADYSCGLEASTMRHDALLASYGRGDVGGVLDHMADEYEMLKRSYVPGTPRVVDVKGRDGVRADLIAFFHSYDVLGITVLNRIVTEWYIFAELDWRVRPKGAGGAAHYRTTAMHRLGNGARMLGEIGYGTDMKGEDVA